MKNILLITLGILLISIAGCKKKDAPQNNATKANITGSVNLYDEGTTPVDISGMQVRIEGSYPAITALTDANGKFTFNDVTFGNYTLVYEKAGYGTYRLTNLDHSYTGGSTIIAFTPSLGQLSSTTVTDLSSGSYGSKIVISATTNPAGNSGNRRYLRFFYSLDNHVSCTHYTKYSNVMISQSNPYELSLSVSDIAKLGFASGSVVYVKAYGDSFWSNNYLDPNSGNQVFPNLNLDAATAVSIVIP